MLVQLIENEFVKNIKKRYFIVLFLTTVALLILFSFNDFSYDENHNETSYQEEMENWFEIAEMATDQETELAPYQKEVYLEYKNIIGYRVEKMRNQSKEENERAVKKAEAFQGGNTMVNVFLFLCALCLPAVIFAGEYSNGNIYQTLMSPCKRNRIFLAKLIMMGSILFFASLYFYIVMQLMGLIFYGGQSISYAYMKEGQVLEISFSLYYLIKVLFFYVQMIALTLFATCISIIVQKKLVTILSAGIVIIISVGVGKFGEMLGAFWYNFIPTISFDLSRQFFRVPVTGEIEALQVAASNVIDITYSNLFMIIYDMILISLLFLTARDAFITQDIR